MNCCFKPSIFMFRTMVRRILKTNCKCNFTKMDCNQKTTFYVFRFKEKKFQYKEYNFQYHAFT